MIARTLPSISTPRTSEHELDVLRPGRRRAMAGGHSGFVNWNTGVDLQLANVVPGTATQTVVTLPEPLPAPRREVADGNSVTCDGLKYGIR